MKNNGFDIQRMNVPEKYVNGVDIVKETLAEYIEKINNKIADRLELIIKRLKLDHLTEDELASRIKKTIVKKFDRDIVLEEYYTFDDKAIMKMILYSNYSCEIKVYKIKLDGK